jgi:CRISPR-associated protein Cas5t
VRALRVEAEGLTTSFRYPHFLVGRQPSFRMPPPATIYGHICSAAGEFIDPVGLRFGYVFTFEGIADDLETLHIATVGRGNMPNDRSLPRNLDVTTNPVPRELLLFPRLTLYIDAPESLERLYRAFREPRFVVVLGRSQDLMSYRRVDVVELEEAEGAYLESTLLPWSFRPRVRAGVGVTMPRFIDPEDRKRVIWSAFVVLEERVWMALPGQEPGSGRYFVRAAGSDERVWIDPETPVLRGLRRGVIWHDFVGGGEDGPNFVSAAAQDLG